MSARSGSSTSRSTTRDCCRRSSPATTPWSIASASCRSAVPSASTGCTTPRRPASAGRTYELGGPKIYTFRALMELLLAEIRRKRLLIEIPFGIASLQARLMAILPSPPLTPDQVELLKRDNVVSTGALTLAMLGITPTAVEAVLPTYLDRFRRGGWYERRRSPLTRAD